MISSIYFKIITYFFYLIVALFLLDITEMLCFVSTSASPMSIQETAFNVK